MMMCIIFERERRRAGSGAKRRRDFLFLAELAYCVRYSLYCVLTTVHRTKDESWPCFQSDSLSLSLSLPTNNNSVVRMWCMYTGAAAAAFRSV
jgi:hypothetical protein